MHDRSYVDFVSALPIALTVEDTTGNTQHIGGMPANGLQTVANGLRAQTAKDGQPWSSLIVQSAGQDLRVLSPNSGITINPSWFQGYYEPYVNQGEIYHDTVSFQGSIMLIPVKCIRSTKHSH